LTKKQERSLEVSSHVSVILLTNQQAQAKQPSTRKDCGVAVKHHGITAQVKSMLTPLKHKIIVTTQAKV
jgi:hypothetical protein